MLPSFDAANFEIDTATKAIGLGLDSAGRVFDVATGKPVADQTAAKRILANAKAKDLAAAKAKAKARAKEVQQAAVEAQAAKNAAASVASAAGGAAKSLLPVIAVGVAGMLIRRALR